MTDNSLRPHLPAPGPESEPTATSSGVGADWVTPADDVAQEPESAIPAESAAAETQFAEPAVDGAGELPLSPVPLSTRALQTVEALLFAADTPLTMARLCELAGIEAPVAQMAIADLNRQYEETGRTFRIHKVALGYQLYTLPEFAETVKKLYRRQYVQRLSGPALEVLAIVAYRQPVTRPEIEQLRGVDCSGPLVTLLERRLITTAGRAHRPGSPFLYRTTREFLRYFGLESLDALPPLEELGAFLAGQMVEPERTAAESLAMDYDAKVLTGTSEPVQECRPVHEPDTPTPTTEASTDQDKREETNSP